MTETAKIFVGRKAELAKWDEILRDPRGMAAVVIGPPGMGKTALLDKIMEVSVAHPDLKCGAVRYEISASDTSDVVMDLLMTNAFEAASVEEGSLDMTERRARQWRALFRACKLDGIVELADSLKHSQAKPLRDQFIARLQMLSDRMPEGGRAIFLIDPEKYMANNSADSWRLVARDLPTKIKLVFAQRPEDEIAKTAPNGDFWQLPNVSMLSGGTGLDHLPPDAVDDFALAAEDTGLTPRELQTVLRRYDGHPFALDAAVRLLRNGATREQLPDRAEPTVFAARQCDIVRESQGKPAVRILRILALLEIATPLEIVREASELDAETTAVALSQPFVRSLVRNEADGIRLYHSLFGEEVRRDLAADKETEVRLRNSAISSMQARVQRPILCLHSARQLWRQVDLRDGRQKAIECYSDFCTPTMESRGVFQTALGDTRNLIDELPPDLKGTMHEGVLFGILGGSLRVAGFIEEAAEATHTALRIYRNVNYSRGIAACVGDLGIILDIRQQHAEAAKMFMAAFKLHRANGDFVGATKQLTNLGAAFTNLGNFIDALKALYMAVYENHMLGRLQSEIRALQNIANVYREMGELQWALQIFEHCALQCDQIGLADGRALARAGIGEIQFLLGNLVSAVESLEKAAITFDAIQLPTRANETRQRISQMKAIYALGRPGVAE